MTLLDLLREAYSQFKPCPQAQAPCQCVCRCLPCRLLAIIKEIEDNQQQEEAA